MRGFSLVLAGCWLAACAAKTEVESGLTGIDMTINYPAALGLDQMRIEGSLADGSEAFRPAAVPESPEPLTLGRNTLVVLLADALGGQTVSVRVIGLQAGAWRVSQERAVAIVREKLVPVSFTLRADGLRQPGVSLSAGGGTAASTQYDVRLVVGAPQPLGQAAGAGLGFDPER